MKRVMLFVIGFMLLSSFAWAKKATVTTTEWGYSITGGTDETVVVAGLLRARIIAFSATAVGDIVVFKSGVVSSPAWEMKSTGASNAPGTYIYFGEAGALFNYLSVKLSADTDEVYIYW